METGDFTIEIGASSRDLPLRAVVNVTSTVDLPVRYDADSILMDVMKTKRGREVMKPLLKIMNATFHPGEAESAASAEAISDDMTLAMLNYMPLRGILSFGGGNLPDGFLENIIAQLNA